MSWAASRRSGCSSSRARGRRARRRRRHLRRRYLHALSLLVSSARRCGGGGRTRGQAQRGLRNAGSASVPDRAVAQSAAHTLGRRRPCLVSPHTDRHAYDPDAAPRSRLGPSAVNAIIAARAALDVRDFDGVESLLNRSDAQASSLAVPRLMLSAESALEQRQPHESLRALDTLRKEAGMHTAALRLELRALQAARRWSDIPPLLDQLVRRKVFDAAQAEHVRVSAQSEQLKLLAQDAGGLREYWSRLPDATKTHPKIARAAARSFMQLGGEREAADILAQSLDREWDSDLVELYGECHLGDATRQLEQAERWLTAHNQDAVLLRVLGTLCQRQQLWGKAQTYLEASLGVNNTWRAHLALGEMLGRLGRDAEANAHFVAALKLATDTLQRM